ncbi:helix-turn-helix domain-containing protein [Dyella koreensis]|uniref:CRP-like protein Clp n=1 Tax=Dyella koreensis TaxID=311235 RepID=A0ABW8KB67_9GAMM
MPAIHTLETPPATRRAHTVGCTGCAHASACQAGGYGKDELSGLRRIVEKVGLLRDGEYLYRPRTPFRALYAVQSGMAKTVTVDSAGREQVLAFHLPGELFALDAICLGYHDNAVIALGRTQFCRFPFDSLRCLATTQPDVQWHLMHTMSRQIHQQRLSGGDYPAEERMAAFLTDLSDRRAMLGLRADHLPLPMSRADIGNHLRLATETVSRLLARFRDAGFIRIDRQGLDILDGRALRDVGRHLLQG